MVDSSRKRPGYLMLLNRKLLLFQVISEEYVATSIKICTVRFLETLIAIYKTIYNTFVTKHNCNKKTYHEWTAGFSYNNKWNIYSVFTCNLLHDYHFKEITLDLLERSYRWYITIYHFLISQTKSQTNGSINLNELRPRLSDMHAHSIFKSS